HLTSRRVRSVLATTRILLCQPAWSARIASRGVLAILFRPMALEVGIVGLPNVGKSTIFNAMTAAGALAANYPFATIEPNVGVVAVPDHRLEVIREHIET